MNEVALMWEVRAAPGEQHRLLDWSRAHAVPAVRAAGCRDVALYGSEQERVVLIAHFAGAGPPDLPEPPAHLAARPAHQWTFDRVL
ncbi:hypothetical protein OOZ19_08495 [Saccharopolyspora sp. NFXS83]|uniref:hypothetical protein n=1 Tax=Saccharopolyspora sp. NFXS83 TaxID=2993560 RepID=UPI00224B9833|nr:hypothetical protein [Saccharopolyspora sp. NFXS83]MCX2730276.1 hypothetical protein [Saccharopolyspora sp. NFXS83]